jgi:hypothetical protein
MLSFFLHLGYDSKKWFNPFVLGWHMYRIKIQGIRSQNFLVDVKNNETLSDLDFILRQKLRLNKYDHCSGFFIDGNLRDPIAIIAPQGGDENSTLTLSSLRLKVGDFFDYIYDFKKNRQYRIEVCAIL